MPSSYLGKSFALNVCRTASIFVLMVLTSGSGFRLIRATKISWPAPTLRDVLGVQLPVASVEDVLQGKIWAVLDPGRRPSKRQKDLADIARLLEAYPQLH